MKKLGWLLLAALPLQSMAQAAVEDPIARPCYMCNANEMYDRAESLGVGEHYLYDGASRTNIQGFNVTEVGGKPIATHFVPPAWIRTQYNEMMKIYDQNRGEFVDEWGTVALQPPGSPHVRSNTVMWGHHVAAVNPRHQEAREIVQRMLSRTFRFDYLRADTEHGRILRFESQLDGGTPLISRLNILHSYLGFIEFFFNYDTRTWEYLESGDRFARMQEKPEDFLSPDGSPRDFRYRRDYTELQPYFVERARWAGVEVIGQLPTFAEVVFSCSRRMEKIQCVINS